MTESAVGMPRRRMLEVLGGGFTGALAGCLTSTGGFDGYQRVRDAPVDGPVGAPWPTLGSDSRRSRHRQTGWLPEQVDVSEFTDAMPSADTQPVFVNGTAYFGGVNIAVEDTSPPVRSPGVIAADQEGKGWLVNEREALAPPTVLGDALFATTNGLTRAFDRRNGDLCWEFGTGSGHPASAPTVQEDTVYVVGDRMVALRARTGALRWASNDLQLELRGTAATEDGVFATAGGEERGALYRIDPGSGGTSWGRKVNTAVDVPPVLGSLVYVMGRDGRLFALDPADGTVSWTQDLGGRSTTMPAVTEETVFAVATNGRAMRTFDARTGSLRWEFRFSDRRARSPTVGQNLVYLPMTTRAGGVIYGLDPETGGVRNVFQLPKPPASPLVLALGMGLIVARSPSMRTLLYALTAKTTG